MTEREFRENLLDQLIDIAKISEIQKELLKNMPNGLTPAMLASLHDIGCFIKSKQNRVVDYVLNYYLDMKKEGGAA